MRRARAGAVKSRIIKITSMEQWERISAKTGDALLFVYVFSPARGNAVRATLAQLARLSAWSHVTFAEVDITQLQEFEQVSGQAGLTTQCYKGGELVGSLRATETSQSRMEQLLRSYAGPKPKPAWWKSALAKVALVGGVLGGAYLGYRRVTRPQKSDEAAMSALNRQIQRTQHLVAMARRQKRSGAAKKASDQLDLLYKQQRALKEEQAGGSRRWKGTDRRLASAAAEGAASDDEATPAPRTAEFEEDESDESDFEL